MAADERRGEPAGQARGTHAWERAVVGWHLAFWLMLALALVALAARDGVDPWQLGAGVAILASLGAAYQVLGRPAVMGLAGSSRATGYLVVVAVTLPALFWLSDGDLTFLLFLGYTQVWVIAESRLMAIAATVALSVTTAASLVLAFGTSEAALRAIGVSVLVGMLFSLVLGLWITEVIRQSAGRAELIAELDAARKDLAEAERAAGAAGERERLARDIHDTLTQGFASIVMLSQVARRELDAAARGDGETDAADTADAHRDTARRQLATIEEVARTNLAEARALVAASSPLEPHGRDLAAALRRLGERFGAETGISIDVDVEVAASSGLTAEQAIVLLRAAQEGLVNVRRHAAARAVRLDLRSCVAEVVLEVRDDGVGFDQAAAARRAARDSPGSLGSGRLEAGAGDDDGAPGGYGLPGLRRRAGDVGGTLRISTAPGSGTRLRVAVPAPQVPVP